MAVNKWKGYGDDWPHGHRLCLACKTIKPFYEFHKHSGCKEGYNTICKYCRKPISKNQYKNLDCKTKIWFRAKNRASQKGLEFNIEVEDIEIPDTCPVLGKRLRVNTKYSPSIDRIDPNKGYIKNNIRIISNRANTLKNNASIEELEALLKDMKKLIPKNSCEVVDL